MINVRQEKLTSVRIRGRWHARYPSAALTLCGLDEPSDTTPGRALPTCGRCSRIARIFHRIDGQSMPVHWLPAPLVSEVLEQRAREAV